MNLKGKGCVSHVPQCLGGKDKFLQGGAKCPCHSFVIIQWLVAGTFHMGEVSMPCGGHCSGADFTNSRNPGGTEHTQTLCIRLFFSYMHERVPG